MAWTKMNDPYSYVEVKIAAFQNKPVRFPSSSISICSEAGVSGNPGIRMISPVIGTRNPAPAAISISRTVMIKSLGRHSNSGLSDRDFCVFAIQIAKPSSPRSWILRKPAFAFEV